MLWAYYNSHSATKQLAKYRRKFTEDSFEIIDKSKKTA